MTFATRQELNMHINEMLPEVTVKLLHGEEDDWGRFSQILLVEGADATTRGLFVRQEFEPYRCTHSYDCCGRIYRGSRPRVQRWNDGLLVFDERYRNI